ncbi:AGAP003343-PA-like protein [Anopheles sinensis]|uniref:AGAP003343-PA-like protein n=1 Tax=Anopheles sinensis TaxID=74873 RepID=A0A084VC19_ANOSI|nr:AGAP003343-PA-like protein [Anopheles sinensis]
MLLTITLLVTVGTLVYLFLAWNVNYWTKRGVPGPAPRLVFGNFPSFILRNRPFVDDFQDIYNKFRYQGNFVGVFNGRTPAILVLKPALLKDVLIKNFKNFQDNEFADSINKESDPIFGRNPFMLKGEEWKEKRAEVTPAFTTSRMKALFPFVEDVTQRMTQYVVKNQVQGPIESRELCAKYTTDVVSSCIFAADAQSFSKEKAEIREMGRKLLEPNFRIVLMFLLIGLVPALKKLFPIAFVPKPIEQFFTRLMDDAVAYREKNGIKRVDYLDHLIGLKARKQLSSLDMAAHGVTFFIDGFETSSLAMSFTLYELARNPDCQEKLRTELLAARNENGTIDYDTLLELPYLDQVLNEALRLWPPAAFLSKVCTVPTELELEDGGRKVLIERGTPVMLPLWQIHRDQEYFEDAERFNPARFAPELGGTKAYREKGCFVPFGDGPRQCLGMRFALMQVKRGIYELVTKYNISVNAKTKQPMLLDPKTFIVAPLGGIWLDYKPIAA